VEQSGGLPAEQLGEEPGPGHEEGYCRGPDHIRELGAVFGPMILEATAQMLSTKNT